MNTCPSLGTIMQSRVYSARPKDQRTPTPTKCQRRNRVQSWPRVFAALEAADRPLLMLELIEATCLKRQNIWAALNYYAELIERTGKPYRYRYALKGKFL